MWEGGKRRTPVLWWQLVPPTRGSSCLPPCYESVDRDSRSESPTCKYFHPQDACGCSYSCHSRKATRRTSCEEKSSRDSCNCDTHACLSGRIRCCNNTTCIDKKGGHKCCAFQSVGCKRQQPQHPSLDHSRGTSRAFCFLDTEDPFRGSCRRIYLWTSDSLTSLVLPLICLRLAAGVSFPGQRGS